MESATKNYGIAIRGDVYDLTPLKHSELVEFIESRRSKTDISKRNLSLLADYSNTAYCNIVNGNHRFTKKSFAAFAKAILSVKTSQLELAIDEKVDDMGVKKYGNRYIWTELNHSSLVDIVENKRKAANLSKEELSKLAGHHRSNYRHYVSGRNRFSKESFDKLCKILDDKIATQLHIPMDQQPEKIEAPVKIEKPIYGVMSIEQMITKIKAAGYKVMRRTEGWEEI